MNRMAKEVAMYLKSYNQTGPGVKAANETLEGFRKSATKIFLNISKVGVAAFTAIATGAVAVGAAFEQGMANTSSMFITAAKSAEELAGWTGMLADKAREMGAQTAFSANEATQAMYALASGGMDANQVIAATDGVMMLAGATMTSLTSSAELTMRTLKMFGLEADQTNRVVNVFAAGIQNSMLNMERLDYAMKYAGPSASILGMSIEETAASVAIIVDQLGDGASAGTGFRMMMTKLLKPTDDLKKVLGGVSVKVDGFGAVMKKLEDAKILDDPEFITRAFGPRSLGAVSALLKAGSSGLKEMTENLTGTNAAAAMYEHQMATINNQWKILRSGMEETGIAIFDVINGPLMGGIKRLQEVVAGSRGDFVSMFRVAADGYGQLVEFVSRATDFFTENKKTIESVGVALTVTASAAIALSYGIAAVSGAITLATNPVFLIAAAVVAAAVGFAELRGETLTFAGVLKYSQDLFSDIQLIAEVSLETISEALAVASEKAQAFSGFISDNMNIIEDVGIVAGTTALAIGILTLATKGYTIASIANSVSQGIQLVAMNATIIAIDLLAFATGALNAVMAVSPIGWIVAGIGLLIGAIAVVVKETIGWEKAWIYLKFGIETLWLAVKLYFKLMFNNVKGLGLGIEAFGKTINEIFTASFETIKNFVSNAGKALDSIGEMFKDPLNAKEHFDAAKTAMSEGLLDSFKGIDKRIAGHWKTAGSTYTEGAKKAWGDFKTESDKVTAKMLEDIAGVDARALEIEISPVIKKDLSAAAILPEDLLVDIPEMVIEISPTISKDFEAVDFFPEDLLLDIPITNALKTDTEKAFIVMDEFGSASRDVISNAWGSILDTSRTGGEKWSAIFDNMKNKAFDVVGQVVMKTIWGEKIKLKAIIMGETEAAAAKGAGAIADTAATTTKVTNAGEEAAANTGAAASGFFKAFSSIPFVGFAMAAAAIGLMMKMLGGLKMAGGGVVAGPGGVDNVPAWLTNKEFVMPVAQTQRYLPTLEAMRAGTFENGGTSLATAGSGNDQPSISVPVSFERGTLLVVDNDLAVNRLATRIWDAAEQGVQTLYKKEQ